MFDPSEWSEFPKALLDSVKPPPGGLTPAEMLELDLKHARRLFAQDHDAIRSESLIATPVYEEFPRGVRVTGIDAVRKGHESSPFADPETHDSQEIRSVGYGHNVMFIEWSRVHKFPDGTRRRCYSIAVVPFEGTKLVGERVYGDLNSLELRDHVRGADFYERPDVTPLETE